MPLGDVVAIDRRRDEGRGHRVEQLGDALASAHAPDARDAGQIERAFVLAGEREDPHLGLHVDEVLAEKPVARHRRGLERILALGHHGLPAGATDALARVDRDDPAVGRVEVGPHVQDGSLVAEHAQLGDVLVDDRNDRRGDVRVLRVAEIGIEETILRVRAIAERDDEIAAVIGDLGADEVARQFLAPVDQPVLVLRSTGAVVPDLVVLEVGLELLACGGLGKARIEEAPAVLGPRDAGEAEPADDAGEILARRDLADADVGPVGAALRQRVGEVAPVGRGLPLRERDAAVGR